MSDELERKIERIDLMQEAIEEKLPRVREFTSGLEERNIKLSWDDLIELSIGFANTHDEEFFEFMRANYAAVTEKDVNIPYVPPSAMIVSTERAEAAIAAVLGIGIGWVWAWLAVSPWTAERAPDAGRNPAGT